MARKFNIVKKKNLPDEARIVGFSFLKKPTEKQKEKKKFDFIETSNQNEIGCMLPKRKSWAYTKGYVEVDNKPNVFVEAKSRLLIILLLILMGCGLLYGVFSNLNPAVVDKLPIIGDFGIFDDQQNKPTDGTTPGEVPMITFAGYGKYSVSEKYPSIELKNPEGNFVDMVFTVTDKDTGELIARTDKVPAGKYVYVNVMNFYQEAGVYTILISTATFDAETGAQMNGMNQKMEVKVIR